MTEIEMLNWARSLKEAYNEAECNAEVAQVADQMADFLDQFIKQNQ
ncbi:MAG: hypothetical protein IJ504_00710 [Bacteroidales bacterium]|nr:hypothetical protein [Bacteroidales bacterium]